jgi:hypothetical protein
MGHKRIKRSITLEDRLAAEAARLREQASQHPPGIEREQLLRKARRNDTGAAMTQWINSPGLRPPE